MGFDECDVKGRLYLRESLREKHGDRLVAVPLTGPVLLIPVSENPVLELRDATAKVRALSTRKLKAVIREAGRQQLVR